MKTLCQLRFVKRFTKGRKWLNIACPRAWKKTHCRHQLFEVCSLATSSFYAERRTTSAQWYQDRIASRKDYLPIGQTLRVPILCLWWTHNHIAVALGVLPFRPLHCAENPHLCPASTGWRASSDLWLLQRHADIRWRLVRDQIVTARGRATVVSAAATR